MRKPFHVFAAAAFALSIVAGGCAKEKTPPQPQPAKKETSAATKTTAPRPKPRVRLFTGTIEALDGEAGTFILKGPKGERRFHAKERVMEQLDGLEIGDKVIVKHVDEIAVTIVKARTSGIALLGEEKRAM